MDWHDLEPRVRYIFEQLAQGKSREEIAQALGYKQTEGLNQYMRRRHYVWNADQNTYEMSTKHLEYAENSQSRPIPARAAQVIARFRQVTADPRQVAQRLNFGDHREMAKYMRECGFVWSSERHNYVFDEKNEKMGSSVSAETEMVDERGCAGLSARSRMSQPYVNWEKYIPILELLHANQDKLVNLLNGTLASTSVVPRYPVTGAYGIKSISMAVGLDQLVKAFSREKNIPQRQIFGGGAGRFLQTIRIWTGGGRNPFSLKFGASRIETSRRSPANYFLKYSLDSVYFISVGLL